MKPSKISQSNAASKAPIKSAKSASGNGTVRKGLKPPLTGPKPSFRDPGGTVR